MPACTRDRTQPKSPQMSAVGCWISSGPESKRSSKPVRQGGHLLPSSLPSPPAASPPSSTPVAPSLFSPTAAPPLPSPPSPALSCAPTAPPAVSPTARVSTISSVSGLARLLVGALSMSNEGGKSIRRRAGRRCDALRQLSTGAASGQHERGTGGRQRTMRMSRNLPPQRMRSIAPICLGRFQQPQNVGPLFMLLPAPAARSLENAPWQTTPRA